METGRLKEEFDRLRTVLLERARAQSSNFYYTVQRSFARAPARRTGSRQYTTPVD